MDALPLLGLNKTLVCLDDLERKGDIITCNKILGLISDLKYQKNCKIVLILNDEKLNDSDKETYEELKEKVIDREIHFNPTSKDCADIVFLQDKYAPKLKELTISLQITNLRILFAIKERAAELIVFLKNFSDEIIHSALHSLVLYCYSSAVKDESIPTLDQIKSVTYSTFFSNIGEKNSNEENIDDKWIKTLTAYDYQRTDSLDLVILEGVQNGYFDETKIIEEANKLNTLLIKDKSENSFRSAWDLYHGSYAHNETEVVQALYDGFSNNIEYLFCDSLNSTVLILRKLNRSDLANELIQLFIDKKSSDPSLFNIENFVIMHHSEIDPSLKNRFEEIYKASVKPKEIEDILLSYIEKSSYNADELSYLNAAEVDQFYDLFKKHQDPTLHKITKSSLELVPAKAKAALIKIGNENVLNKLRIEKFKFN